MISVWSYWSYLDRVLFGADFLLENPNGAEYDVGVACLPG
jgi:hypothetical protein